MEKREKEVRKKMVIVRVNESEYKQLEHLHEQSAHKYLSTYARKVLLQNPVVLKYRNQSADEFLREMIGLKKQLNGIGNNFNQAVHKLHMVEKIPEFRMWILNYDGLLETVAKKIDEIKIRIEELYQQINTGHKGHGRNTKDTTL